MAHIWLGHQHCWACPRRRVSVAPRLRVCGKALGFVRRHLGKAPPQDLSTNSPIGTPVTGPLPGSSPGLGVSSPAGSNLPGAAPPPRVSRSTDRQVTLWTWGCQDPDNVLMSKRKQSCRPLTSHWQVERLRRPPLQQRERQPVPSGLRQPSGQTLQLALRGSSRAPAGISRLFPARCKPRNGKWPKSAPETLDLRGGHNGH